MIHRDRCHAGRELAARLHQYAARDDVLVLALPRGGVPVALEVAQALQAPLDVALVRKLGVPGHDITRRLIEEKGFTAVAVEADWPDAYRVNRFVLGEGGDADADAALGGFRRFPAWMWRNTDMLAFVRWLRARNDAVADSGGKAGFYGLDLYSLHASITAVLDYLDRHDPAAATPKGSSPSRMRAWCAMPRPTTAACSAAATCPGTPGTAT